MDTLPIVLIEIVLVFGGVLAFGWWQLRSVRRDQRKAADDRQRARTAAAAGAADRDKHGGAGGGSAA